ncbi:NAD(P)/FAD-dependent oxidoreductase [Candidatus Pyrohabitans sp.]
MGSYDVIVVGGGPAGLSAGIFCAERGMRVAVFESGSFGGALVSIYPGKLVLNYPGFPSGIRAKELAELFIKQARDYGVELKKERVLEITPQLRVKTDSAQYSAKAVVIATGTRPRELGIPGEAEFNYADLGVYYSVTDPERFAGRRVLVVGGGDSALEHAVELSRVASVTLVHRRGEFRANQKNVERLSRSDVKVLLNTEVEEIGGESKVEWVKLRSAGGELKIEVDAVVLAVGHVPNSEIFAKLGLECDSDGRIKTDAAQRTSVPGIYAAGDIVSGVGHLELLVVAVAQGAVAAHNIYVELYEPYWA